MKRITTTLAALSLTLAAGAALAQEATYDYPQAVSSLTTRAAVQAELMAARASGSLQVGEAMAGVQTPFVAQRSRADVRSETRSAAASGELARLHRESNAFAPEQHAAAARLIVAAT